MNFKTKSLIVFILTFYFLFNTSISYADSSPSADLQSKINALKEEIASKAVQLKAEINQKLQNRALAGLVQSRTDSQIILATLASQNRTILINTYTDISTSDNGLTDKIKKDDFIVALGDLDDKNNLVAKKIIKMKAPGTQVSSFWGKIQSINTNSFIILTKDGKNLTIKITKDTAIQIGKNSGSFSDLEMSKFIITSGFQDKEGSISARFIYQIPTAGFIRQKLASSSATQSASSKP